VTGTRARLGEVRSNLVVSARITPLPQQLGDPLPGVCRINGVSGLA
jgi:hypothetical protein